MADKIWFVLPPEGHITKEFAAWLRKKGATVSATGKAPRATRSDKGKKRKWPAVTGYPKNPYIGIPAKKITREFSENQGANKGVLA